MVEILSGELEETQAQRDAKFAGKFNEWLDSAADKTSKRHGRNKAKLNALDGKLSLQKVPRTHLMHLKRLALTFLLVGTLVLAVSLTEDQSEATAETPVEDAGFDAN